MKKCDKLAKKYIDEFTEEFDSLVAKDNLNIGSLENLMIENVENYEKELRVQVEELLMTHIDEKSLISKKNENGKKKYSN